MSNFFGTTSTEEPPALFNAEALEDTTEAVLCRDRDEVSALLDCGVVGAITVVGDRWLPVLAENADRLTGLSKITLAIAPGSFREELVRRFGRHRCWLLDRPIAEVYPEGAIAVLKALHEAVPYPIEGMHRVTVENLLALHRRTAPVVMSTGTRASDDRLRLPTEGRLIVVTGIPNHGKTAWTRFVMVHTAAKHNRRWCVFSPESQPWEEFVAQCAEAYSEKPFHPIAGVASMTVEDINEAGAFMSDRITMLVCDAEDQAPTMEWLLERARASVLRNGTTDFLVDPWNEVDQQRGAMSETDYIGRCLQRFKAFALRHGCNVWIIAHPAKPAPARPNEKRPAPGPYDISGSSQWANKADLGLTLHSPSAGVAELHLWKSRTRRWGTRGTVATMDYDQLTGVYRTPVKASSDDPVLDLGQWR